MVLLQAGRLNIELDYDSLHYGLRSGFVLDNGKGIYENLGMNNLVYSYSKGLEVLNLPLSGTPTYGFVLAFLLDNCGNSASGRTYRREKRRKNHGFVDSRCMCCHSGHYEYGSVCKERQHYPFVPADHL